MSDAPRYPNNTWVVKPVPRVLRHDGRALDPTTFFQVVGIAILPTPCHAELNYLPLNEFALNQC